MQRSAVYQTRGRLVRGKKESPSSSSQSIHVIYPIYKNNLCHFTEEKLRWLFRKGF
jgi:hypothetical protein